MTSPLAEGRQLIGLPVVELATGDAVADVRDVVFDPSSGGLAGFTLNSRGGGWWTRFTAGHKKEVLTMARVRSVGPHAVMIGDASAMVDPDAVDATAVTEADPAQDEVTDDRVITQSGHALGHVVDVILRTGRDPHVVGYRIKDDAGAETFIPVAAASAVSGTALIVPDDYAARRSDDMTGLAAQLQSLQEASS